MFEEFQDQFLDGHHGGQLGYKNGMILVILNLNVSPMPPLSFGLIRLIVGKEMSFEDFQDGRHGGHLGYRNGKILAFLNLHVASMPSTKLQLNPTYDSGRDVENVKSSR